MTNRDALKKAVHAKYRAKALHISKGGRCCDTPVTSGLYGKRETKGLPAQAVEASLGCGNPSMRAELKPGEAVLDLGSGGGIDVLLAARRVGPSGRVIGLDFCDEMLALARKNQKRSGIGNAEFIKGELERIPLPGNSVDVVLSNCVINLSTDKGRTLAEAFRVLRPGGRLVVSDIVSYGAMSPSLRRKSEAWAGCVSGAMEESDYLSALSDAGFVSVSIRAEREYPVPGDAPRGALKSALVWASKPAAAGKRRARGNA